jgi:predicted nuclease of predicted toxin-antitoxin system
VALLYADEGFSKVATELLRQLGHDVLTVQEAGQANQRIPDDQVLAFATSQGRAVLTVNRDDFIRLHRMSSDHAGIVVCTEDLNRQRLATRIHETITAEVSLVGKLLRVNRPSAERGE